MLNSQPILENSKLNDHHTLLINQRHWTHPLCWNMQRLFEWSGHPSWEIRGTGLTIYVGTCKGCLSDQDIPPEKSEALDSLPMLEHANISVKFIFNEVHLPIRQILNENFGQIISLSIAWPTFYTSLVSKHCSTFNLVQISTHILNLKSEYHITRNIPKHTF